MADLRGQKLKDSYQNVVTDSGSDLAGIENGNGIDITGRIVERDSNSDGEFVRFANGTQICLSNTLSVSGTDPIGEIFRSTAPERVTWNFPQDFIDSSAVVSPFTGTTSGVVNFTGGSIGNNTSVSAALLNAVGLSDISIKLQAIGSWK